MKPFNPEVIRAITPLFIAGVGAVIAVVVIVSPKMNDAKWSAGFGLAGTAIAGAAGLAQTSKSESDFPVRKQGDDMEIKNSTSKSHDT